MTTRIKNILGIAAVLALLSFAYAVVQYAGAYSSSIEPSSYRSFTVSAEGKVTAIPDIAEFRASVITEGGTDLGALRDENTEKVNGMIAFLKEQEVEREDIQTVTYNIEPRYKYYRCDDRVRAVEPCLPPEIVGYSIRQTITVKIRDFSVIGMVLSGVVEYGANSVSQFRFTIDDRTLLEAEARARAIAKAREKARTIARGGGFSVGKILSITEGYTPVYPRSFAVAVGEGYESGGDAAVQSIEPGSQEITVQMTVRYEIR